MVEKNNINNVAVLPKVQQLRNVYQVLAWERGERLPKSLFLGTGGEAQKYFWDHRNDTKYVLIHLHKMGTPLKKRKR